MAAPRSISETVWDWRTRAADSGSRAVAVRAGARRRGLLQGAIGLAAALALGLWWRPTAGYLVLSVTAAMTLLALLLPVAHGRVQQGLQTFGRGVGLLLTWLLMPVFFYLVFFPFGLFLRARGRLRIARRPDANLPTYWAEPARTPTPESYRRQF